MWQRDTDTVVLENEKGKHFAGMRNEIGGLQREVSISVSKDTLILYMFPSDILVKDVKRCILASLL